MIPEYFRPWKAMADKAGDPETPKPEAVSLYKQAASLARSRGCHSLACAYDATWWRLSHEDAGR